MKLKNNYYSLLYLTMAFMLFTVAGTVLHEYGHIAVARWLGYRTSLHYGSMNWEANKELSSIHARYAHEIKARLPYPKQEQYQQAKARYKKDSLLILSGGPLQTILTGLTGFLLLCYRRKTIAANNLKAIDWLLVFLALFWLRAVFNVVMSCTTGFLSNSGRYFGGDEAIISRMLALPSGTISLILSLPGLLISLFVIYKIIPLQHRITFICSGQLGGTMGFILWMKLIGPVVLP